MADEVNPPVKVKKPRSAAQIAASAKLVETNRLKREAKAKEKEKAVKAAKKEERELKKAQKAIVVEVVKPKRQYKKKSPPPPPPSPEPETDEEEYEGYYEEEIQYEPQIVVVDDFEPPIEKAPSPINVRIPRKFRAF